jgi:hypothetical protein
VSTIVSETRATLPPIQCTPWCEQGDGHPNEVHPLEQYCASETVHVRLTRENPIEGHLDDVSAYLVHDRFEAEPHVTVGHNDQHVAAMTLDEAEEYFRKGLLLVSAARAAARQ